LINPFQHQKDGAITTTAKKNTQYSPVPKAVESERWSKSIYSCSRYVRAEWSTCCERICEESKGIVVLIPVFAFAFSCITFKYGILVLKTTSFAFRLLCATLTEKRLLLCFFKQCLSHVAITLLLESS
jgi:hypothetical protein